MTILPDNVSVATTFNDAAKHLFGYNDQQLAEAFTPVNASEANFKTVSFLWKYVQTPSGPTLRFDDIITSFLKIMCGVFCFADYSIHCIGRRLLHLTST